MATSTVISAARPNHRTARVQADGFQGALALDWANGQVVLAGAVSGVSAVFDPVNDLIVMVSGVPVTANTQGFWLTVGVNPVAVSQTAGNMSMTGVVPVPIYVPAGMQIAVIRQQTNHSVSMIPALLAGS